MTRIVREPIRAANEDYDIVIVGGGIYGAMLLLVATAHDLKAILIERNDFGSQTSFNSLRIIHGGLRYLQSLDIPRSKAMIAERAWFLKNFPDLIFHLPCLMPIYNRGLRSKSMLRFALRLDKLLSSNARRSRGWRPSFMAPQWKKAKQEIDTSCTEADTERRKNSANRYEADL